MPAGHATTTPDEYRARGYLLVTEAARKIKKTPHTIYRWIEDERVVGFREGYRHFVLWSSVLSHMGQEACAVRDLSQEDIWEESDLQCAKS